MYFYVKLDGSIDGIATDYKTLTDLSSGGTIKWRDDTDGEGWIDRHDIDSFEKAEALAVAASAFSNKPFIATEGSSNHFEVIEAPAVGDLVSGGFNGDYSPEGTIVKVSKTLALITTSTGKKFYRRGPRSGSWVCNGYRHMVGGHIQERNPHF